MKRMLTLRYTILLTMLPLSVFAQLSFKDVAFWPSIETYGAAVSLDLGTVLIAGTGGLILKTTDIGNTWQKFNTGPAEPGRPDQLFAPDPVNLFMGYDLYGNPDPGYAWYSSHDAGQSWNVIEFPAGLKVFDIHFFDAAHWLAVGVDSLMMRTFDGGLTWDILQHSDSSGYTILEVLFLDDTRGWYSAGYNRTLFTTSDGGINWQPISSGNFFDLQFVNPLIAFARGDNDIYKTTNGGNTWFSIYQELSGEFEFHAIDSEHIYISYGFPSNPNGPAPTVKYSSDGGNTWAATNYTNNSFKIYDITAVNNKVMLVGAWGYIAVLEEPLVLKSLTGSMMTGIFAFEDKAIVTGYDGELFWIKDEGNTWEKIDVEFSGGPNQIKFINDSIGFIIGSTFLRTKDGGNTWDNITINLQSAPRYTFTVDRNDNIYIKNQVSPILRSSDLGETWTEIPLSFSTLDFFVYDSLHLWASTYNNFYRSTDGGLTWDTISSSWTRACEFVSPDSGYGFHTDGYGYAVLSETTDGGLSWVPKIPSSNHPHYIYQAEHHPDYTSLLELTGYSGFDESIHDFQFSEWKDESHETLLRFTAKEGAAFSFYNRYSGWIAAGRKVFRVLDESVTGTYEAAENLRLHYELFNNYPNPFNPSTTISFHIAEKAFVSLKVYDVLGNIVSELVSEEKLPGRYQAELHGASLSSGIYFYRLKAGPFIQTRKMILLK